MNPDHIGMWNRIPAIIVTGLETEDAKNLYRIKANLERNEYTAAEKALLVKEMVRIEGVVRKGKPIKKVNPSESVNPSNCTVYQGRSAGPSPATQLAEKYGYSRNTMVSRFKQWAEANKYQGPMSSVEDHRRKSRRAFC